MSKEAAASQEAYKVYEQWQAVDREAAAAIALDTYRRAMAQAVQNG